MIDLLATSLPLKFVETLQEYTNAKARQAFNVPRDITPNAHQRLIGHARQDALQEAFRMAAVTCDVSIADFSPQRGMPSRFVADFGKFNLVAMKNKATKTTVEQACKALAMIANEKFSQGAEVVDLFTGSRIIEANKPLFAWSAVWKGSKVQASALPTWTGLCQVEATDERHVRAVGVGVGFGQLRAEILAAEAPKTAAKKKSKFTPRTVPSASVNEDDQG